MLNAVPVTQPTVSKHSPELKELTPNYGKIAQLHQTFLIYHQTTEEKGRVPLIPAL